MSSPIQSSMTVQNAIDLCAQQSLPDDKKFEIVENLVSKEFAKIAEKFQDFRFGSEECRFKAAALIAKKSSRIISFHIHNFNLSQAHIAQLAYQAMHNDPAGTLSHIQNYTLGEEDACAIGITAARAQPAKTAEHFESLGIHQVENAFAIAKTAFKTNARGCSKFIKNFHFQEETKRFELLSLRLEADADKALELLKLFEIKEPRYIFAAALIAAKYDGWQFSSEVDHWNIASEEDRFTLFERALKGDDITSVGALHFLDNYHFSEPYKMAAFELAIKNKIAPLGEFVIKSKLDEKSRKALGHLYAAENPEKFLIELEKWGFSEPDKTYFRDLASKAKT